MYKIKVKKKPFQVSITVYRRVNTPWFRFWFPIPVTWMTISGATRAPSPTKYVNEYKEYYKVDEDNIEYVGFKE